MAGNALPIVLLAGAAFFLARKKGTTAPSGVLPADQGSVIGADPDPTETTTGGGAPDEEESFRVDWTYNSALNMPWVETLEDYEAWRADLDAGEDDRIWTGALEFRDMEPHHAEYGIFIEGQLNAYSHTFGRTIDRAELDPAARDAMSTSDMAPIEAAIGQTFVDFEGLDFLLMFLNDTVPAKLSILFVFDSQASQEASVSGVADFNEKWGSLGLQVISKVGHIGMVAPSLEDIIQAFMGMTLPKKTQQGPITGITGQGPVTGGLGPSFNP